MCDVDHGPPAEEGHVRGQTAHTGGTGHVCVRHSHPVTVDNQPQVSLLTRVGCLSGEEELVDPFNRSPERSGSPAEGSAHIHQNLTVPDPVHFTCEKARVRGKEVDLSGRH